MQNELSIDVIIKNRNVVVSSLQIASHFHKRHKNVLQKIDDLKDDWKKMLEMISAEKSAQLNDRDLSSKVRAVPEFKDCFFESDYLTEDGRRVRSYDMNRQGFILLVNGFNGKNALLVKLAIIARFDEMEEELTKRSTLYELEKLLRKNLTDTIFEVFEGNPPERSYSKFTDLLYISVVGNKAEKIKRDRGFEKDCSVFADILTSEERTEYIEKENELIRCFKNGFTDYHELKEIITKKKVDEVA